MASNPTTPTTAPMLVDRREAARLMGVSPGTIDNLRTRGELPSVKLMSRRLFDVADLRQYVLAAKLVDENPSDLTFATAAPAASVHAGGLVGGAT